MSEKFTDKCNTITIKIEKFWIYKGLQCIVTTVSCGHRCGYVRVPLGNRFYGIRINENVPGAKVNLNRPLGDSFSGMISLIGGTESLENFVTTLVGIMDVHGGITFSSNNVVFEQENSDPLAWYIGFDCAHCFDLKDPSIMSDYYKSIDLNRFTKYNHPDSKMWTLPMVVEEVEKLADQVYNERGLYEVDDKKS